jgi:hypothetical protein
MRRAVTKHRVDSLVEKHFWEGFWCGIRGGKDDGWGLTYSYAPSWYDRVADISDRAGWQAAQEIMEERERARISFPSHAPPVIPGKVYAECYGEAHIAVRQRQLEEVADEAQ